MPLGITLLLPQDGLNLLGYASRPLLPDKGRGGISRGAVLAAIHTFYAEEMKLPLGLCRHFGVPLKDDVQCRRVQCAGSNNMSAEWGEVDETRLGKAAAGAPELMRESELEADVVCVSRALLLGPCCCFGGLQRLSRDALSTVYQVVLS